jgi:Fe-S oxidoreductase
LRAWIFANIHRVNQLAGIVPSLSNAVLSSAWGKGLMSLVGLPIDRALPLYSVQRFTAAVAANRNNHLPQSDSVATLIVDTYTEYNHPEVGLAVLKIADALGLRLNVRALPSGSTGRPAISKGLLDDAKRMAEHNLRELNPADGPFLYLEPSELSAVIDDYLTLVSPELQAKARDIANVSMSAEAWLAAQLANAPDIRWDETPREILLHGHCHQKALWGTQDTLALLRSIPNATVKEMNSGCCGVAGSFGYEHYELSMKVAQDRLLPAIEAAPSGTIITAPGTSCRAQIHDNGHPVLHPVEVVAAAIRSAL